MTWFSDCCEAPGYPPAVGWLRGGERVHRNLQIRSAINLKRYPPMHGDAPVLTGFYDMSFSRRDFPLRPIALLKCRAGKERPELEISLSQGAVPGGRVSLDCTASCPMFPTQNYTGSRGYEPCCSPRHEQGTVISMINLVHSAEVAFELPSGEALKWTRTAAQPLDIYI